MRPLKLSLRAFGPFVRQQSLDFSELNSHRLFLIGGPTGAGKTTLLDAMCFALYGASSGNERDTKRMRSDHADAATLTEVIFEFAIGARRFRVKRIPEQERAKLRGGGTTTEKQDATLWERTAAETDTEGAVLANGWSKVTEAVETLIGFSSAQFRQVIILPQGQFRELLVANSVEREAILRTLFGTDLYSRIQDALKQRAAAVKNEAESCQIRRADKLNQAEVDNDEALAEKISSQAEDIKKLRIHVEQLKTTERAALQALQQGERAVEKLTTLEAAQQALQALEARFEKIQTQRQILHRAQQADALRDLYQQLADQRSQCEQLHQSLRDAVSQRDRAQTVYQKAQETLRQEQTRDAIRQDLRRDLDDLRKLQERVRELAEAQQQNSQWQKSFSVQQRATASAEAQLEKLQTKLSRAIASKEELSQIAGRRDLIANQVEQLQRHSDNLSALQNKRAQAKKLATGISEQQTCLQAAEQQLIDKQRKYNEMQAHWLNSQAAILADSLIAGEPCPVCGSDHHPAPAKAEAKTPAERDVIKAKEVWVTAQATRETEKEKLTELQHRAFGLTVQIEELEKSLEDYRTAAVAELKNKLAERQTALQQADQSQAELNNLVKTIESLEISKVQTVEKVNTAKQQQANTEKALAVSQATIAERERDVPFQWREPGALDNAIITKNEALLEAEQALEDARKAAQLQNDVLIKAKTSVEALQTQQQTSAQQLNALQAHWTTRRDNAGFLDDGAFTQALLDDSKKTELENEIKVFDEHWQSAKTTFANAKAAAQDIAKPDMAALITNEKNAREAREREERQCATTEEQHKHLLQIKEGLDDVAQQLAKYEHTYGIVGRLADVANSKNSYRLSFQRFVLTALLDDVLIAASRRLQAMSRGRYRLERQCEHGDQRTLGGLDLLVEDSYTGKLRPVETLSGGESFQAALGLALGLAEVVQAYAGGTRLDAIFIDEGFGSLDPEALELAVNTLIDLQQGGRLVGIISHVPELKERIDVRLEITPHRSGSTAHFVLP